MKDAPNALRTVFATLLIVLPLSASAETPGSTSGEPKPFSWMAIAPDAGEACRVPRPPADLAETAYLRNGYRAILRILVAERHLKAETCDCLLGEFTWGMALAELPRFQTSDNPRLPFKVLDLYAMADALEAEHAEGCSE
ncbi:hypothetical protein SAMN04488523_1147 [Sulfitobacter brevis]|uniref:Rap1a immunity protein domain-containing protein n=2 Tax=Sulfitobacter brevis TaxID=74348 RepID=A0A1I2EZ64_9RHOB|nr:hypothetical protein SAMN04488523_1147 [Sulfitobacter brevis]